VRLELAAERRPAETLGLIGKLEKVPLSEGIGADIV